MTPDTPADGEALAEAIAELRRAKAEDSVTIDTHDALDMVLNAVLSGALIPRPAEPAQVDVRARLAAARETFCMASPGSDEEFTSLLLGFDTAAAIINGPKT